MNYLNTKSLAELKELIKIYAAQNKERRQAEINLLVEIVNDIENLNEHLDEYSTDPAREEQQPSYYNFAPMNNMTDLEQLETKLKENAHFKISLVSGLNV